MKQRLFALLLALLMMLSLFTGCGSNDAQDVLNDVLDILEELESSVSQDDTFLPSEDFAEDASSVSDSFSDISIPDINGSYTSKEDVALYIHCYGTLPKNFITKAEARAMGWEGGSLEPYAPGYCIGGDPFGNYEGLLPEDRTYTECDIDTMGAAGRGAKRIVFSEDGLIYYTADHYETFTLLYGEE